MSVSGAWLFPFPWRVDCSLRCYGRIPPYTAAAERGHRRVTLLQMTVVWPGHPLPYPQQMIPIKLGEPPKSVKHAQGQRSGLTLWPSHTLLRCLFLWSPFLYLRLVPVTAGNMDALALCSHVLLTSWLPGSITVT